MLGTGQQVFVDGGMVCKPILVFNLAQAEQQSKVLSSLFMSPGSNTLPLQYPLCMNHTVKNTRPENFMQTNK